MMFEFCPFGVVCGPYRGPSCWCGTANLSQCEHSPSILWQGASQPNPPPPTPPTPQRFKPRSLATAPLSQLDLGDESGGAWSLSVDGAPSRSIRVPSGGYSSDFQDSPLIDQYAVKSSVVYSRVFRVPSSTAPGSVWHLAFGSVNHAAKVSVNGTLVGYHQGPMMPFEVDITSALASAGGGSILLTVEAFPYQTLVGSVPSGFMYAESWKSENSTSGWTSRSCAGMCRYVWLLELPPIRVLRLRTRASVAPPASLTVTAEVVNDSPTLIPAGGLTLSGEFSSWNSLAWSYPTVPSQTLQGDLAPNGGLGLLEFSVGWLAGEASWWWPNRPYSEGYLAQLHFLNVSLSPPTSHPALNSTSGSVRFGFVEHSSAGFYWMLNGLRVNHLSDATPENGMSYYDAYAFSESWIAQNPRELWRKYMRVGITSNRIHQSTPTEAMLAAADEVGFL